MAAIERFLNLPFRKKALADSLASNIGTSSRNSHENDETPLSITQAVITSQETRLLPAAHVVYRIEIESTQGRWAVYRRFSDFVLLDSLIRRELPTLLCLPSKNKLLTGITPEQKNKFAEIRQQGLGAYLSSLLTSTKSATSASPSLISQLHEFFATPLTATDSNEWIATNHSIDSVKNSWPLVEFRLDGIILNQQDHTSKLIRIRSLIAGEIVVIKPIGFFQTNFLCQDMEELLLLYDCQSLLPHTGVVHGHGIVAVAKPFMDCRKSWSRLLKLTYQEKMAALAQIVAAVAYVHENNFFCIDLDCDSILLDDNHLVHVSLWRMVHQRHFKTDINLLDLFLGECRLHQLLKDIPELCHGFEYGKHSDWFLVGLLAHQLLCDSICDEKQVLIEGISYPASLPEDSRNLVSSLLKEDPLDRLGSGVCGSDDVMMMPCFASVDWRAMHRHDAASSEFCFV